MPLHEAVKYVAAAYIVAFVLILVYLAIMATRLKRVERDLDKVLSGVPRNDGPDLPGSQRWERTEQDLAAEPDGIGAGLPAGSGQHDVGRPGSRVA